MNSKDYTDRAETCLLVADSAFQALKRQASLGIMLNDQTTEGLTTLIKSYLEEAQSNSQAAIQSKADRK